MYACVLYVVAESGQSDVLASQSGPGIQICLFLLVRVCIFPAGLMDKAAECVRLIPIRRWQAKIHRQKAKSSEAAD
jgi:hypothetical protein